MNIFAVMSIILYRQYVTTIATVLIFGIFFPQDLENAKKSSNASEQTASADARSVPKCRQIRNVPNCRLLGAVGIIVVLH